MFEWLLVIGGVGTGVIKRKHKMPPVQGEHWVEALSGLQKQMESPWSLIGRGCCKGTETNLTYFMILLEPALLLPTSFDLLLRLRFPFGPMDPGP